MLSHAIFVSASLTFKSKNQVQSCDFSRYLEVYINSLARLYGLLKPNQIYSPSKTLSKLKSATGTFKTLGRSPSIIHHQPPLHLHLFLQKLYHKHNSKKIHVTVALHKLNPQCNFKKLIEKPYNTNQARYTSKLHTLCRIKKNLTYYVKTSLF